MVIGYVSDNNANRFLIINFEISDIAKNAIVEVMDAHYFENIFPYKIRPNIGITEDNLDSSSIQAKLNSSQVRHLKKKLNLNLGEVREPE